MKSLRLVWAAAWRAQAMHLGLFVAMPALAALMHAAMGVVLLPFLLLGEGDRRAALGSQVHHLQQPGCWLALAPCSVADGELFALPSGIASKEARSADVEPFLPVPQSFNWRHAWFVGWLAWFIVHLVRPDRTHPPGSPAP